MRQLRDRAQRELDRLEEIWTSFSKLDVQQLIADEGLYRELYDRYGDYFTGSMGAEAIQTLLQNFDIAAEAENLRETIRSGKGQKKLRALKRLKVVAAFQATGNSPMGMVLDCVPVIPPDLRPMVQLDGGRFATTDLNDLYRRVINRNNRLKRLIDLGAPEIIVNNEKRMLQEAVDALFDNGRRGRPVTGPGNRPLKSLSDLLKGKQGRFRQNLLGKRVDYSGRSVIVVGPQLKLHQCGLPKQMALELFKPFVMKRLVDLNHAQNIKSAKRMVERGRSQVWDVLEEVISEHPVLLNRAPTLHRLGIQAFEPQLVEGKAIQLHPLVCEAFNADFDGDQMAVHLPLSAEAQSEARVLMLSSEQHPVARLRAAAGDAAPGHGHRPVPPEPAARGRDGRGARVLVAWPRRSWPTTARCSTCRRRSRSGSPTWCRRPRSPRRWPRTAGSPATPWLADTTLGRVLFNELLPADYPFVNEPLPKKRQAAIINDLAERYSMTEVAQVLDRLKDAGFYWATRSGVTIAISDVIVPPNKQTILDGYEVKADQVNKRYQRGALSHQERNDEMVKIWSQASEEVARAMEENFPEDNPIPTIVKSGAAGNMTQVRQLAGMRGLVANPKGEYIPRPIKANFREGLSVLEYFISTHGTRKGLADTALRTADSGYLTRRLVDVSQDVIVREVDCGTERSSHDGRHGGDLRRAPAGRTATSAPASTRARSAEDVTGPDGELVVRRGDDLGDPALEALVAAGVKTIKVRSALTCTSATGICGYVLRPLDGHRQAGGRRRGGRHRRGAVDR